MKDLILDIGIGQGGRYLNNPDVKHIGIDISRGKLLEVEQEYWRNSDFNLVQADGYDNLPFKSGIFNRLNLYFPYYLFYGLLDTKYYLWGEMNRVLKEGGEIDMVFDTYRYDSGKVVKKIEILDLSINDYITHPVERVIKMGRSAGFCINDNLVNPFDLQVELGSFFSKRTLRSWQKDQHFEVHRLQAIKSTPAKVSRSSLILGSKI